MKNFLKRHIFTVPIAEPPYIHFFKWKIPYGIYEDYREDGGVPYAETYEHGFGLERRIGRERLPYICESPWDYPDHQLHFLVKGDMTDADRRRFVEFNYYEQNGCFPDFDHPRKLTEKVLWHFLYGNKAQIAETNDKIRAKEWVAQRIGEEHVVPLYGVYDHACEIDFDQLPNSFTVKSNLGNGGHQVAFVHDKSRTDPDELRRVIDSWMYPWENFSSLSLDISPCNGRPRILVEQFLDQGPGHEKATNYKWYCLNGEPVFGLFTSDSYSERIQQTFIDTEGKPVPYRFTKEVSYGYTDHFPLPDTFGEMLEISRKLASEFTIARVDLYDVGGRIYVGEMTTEVVLGSPIHPVEWDYRLGERLDLSREMEAYKARMH